MMEHKKLRSWFRANQEQKNEMLYRLIEMVDDYLAPSRPPIHFNEDDEIDFAIQMIGKLTKSPAIELYAKPVEDYVFKVVVVERALDEAALSESISVSHSWFYYDHRSQKIGQESWIKNWPRAG